MLVENQKVFVNWHPRNKKHLESKGYKYTKIGDSVCVKLEDLMPGSKCRIKYICDYCGRIIEISYKDYLRRHKEIGKDCCSICHEKGMETNRERYGGNSPSCSERVREKQKETFMNLYGVPYISQSKEIQTKIEETNLRKFGFKRASQSPEIKQKAIDTCMKNYGVPYSQCCEEVRAKTLSTRYKNGSIPTSKPENETVEMLKKIYGEQNCFPQFVLDKICFDCLVIVGDIKIDVEYDGTFWHQDKQKDLRRDYFTASKGYKILRIKGNYEIPTESQIKDAISYLVKTNHIHATIELDI